VCTLENEADALLCAVCDSGRPHRMPLPPIVEVAQGPAHGDIESGYKGGADDDADTVADDEECKHGEALDVGDGLSATLGGPPPLEPLPGALPSETGGTDGSSTGAVHPPVDPVAEFHAVCVAYNDVASSLVRDNYIYYNVGAVPGDCGREGVGASRVVGLSTDPAALSSLCAAVLSLPAPTVRAWSCLCLFPFPTSPPPLPPSLPFPPPHTRTTQPVSIACSKLVEWHDKPESIAFANQHLKDVLAIMVKQSGLAAVDHTNCSGAMYNSIKFVALRAAVGDLGAVNVLSVLLDSTAAMYRGSIDTVRWGKWTGCQCPVPCCT
jgi:hypothetical protein